MLNYERAKADDGRFLLRIEDIDFVRCKPECETAIYEDLAWLGLDWETPVRRQSDRLHVYDAVLQDFYAKGLVYRCFKTRKDIEEAMSAPHALPQAFTGGPLPEAEETAFMEQGAPYAWRLSMRAARAAFGAEAFDALTYTEEMPDGSRHVRHANTLRHGDVILARKDIRTSYHLSCVIDDGDQGITLVIRGDELADVAGLHTFLFRMLGHDVPVFRHHPLVNDENGRRLAKRDQSIALRTLRAGGATPGDIRARLKRLTETP